MHYGNCAHGSTGFAASYSVKEVPVKILCCAVRGQIEVQQELPASPALSRHGPAATVQHVFLRGEAPLGQGQ